MVFIVVLVVVGLWKRRKSGIYWKYAAAAVGIQVVVQYLFAGGGTLQDPSGDGAITQVVRAATDDGPAMAVFAVAVLLLSWVLPVGLVSHGYRKSAPKAPPG